ncbi:MAG: alpha-amylase family glycosyl hydrolase, partial [Rhodothermales bacterium]
MPTTNDAASPRPHPRPDARLGALVEDDGTRFRVWSPSASSLTVVLESGERLEMTPRSDDIFEAFSPGATTGVRYRIELDGDEAFPDPASRYQPDGVHGASSIVDPSAYAWSDGQWEGASREDLVFYEIHTGTFTPEGTFEGIRSRLPYLRDLGVTALELMPVADFPGRWNWGYDHAALYAPSRAYGTPDELRRLVDEAHEMGLAVFLDVIYNHLGPDGAYVAAFAPMFTDRHETPWGQAVNLDDQYSAGVRGLFIDNALSWLLEYHVDGLRLDATHALVDESEVHFLEELQETVERIGAGPERLLIAEDHRNENRIVRPRAEGGYGLAAVWADDFHHQIRNLTAGDEDGYYVDYAGTTTR